MVFLKPRPCSQSFNVSSAVAFAAARSSFVRRMNPARKAAGTPVAMHIEACPNHAIRFNDVFSKNCSQAIGHSRTTRSSAARNRERSRRNAAYASRHSSAVIPAGGTVSYIPAGTHSHAVQG